MTTPDTVIHLEDHWPLTARDYLNEARRKDAYADWCEEQARKGWPTHREYAIAARREAKALAQKAAQLNSAPRLPMYKTGR
jgi:hypothetical protein